MNYRFIFEPVALGEYKDAIRWYKKRSVTAAVNFVAAVKEKIETVCADPTRYRNLYKEFRETSLKRYPYYVVYYIDEHSKTIVITSVYHHKRNPKRKYRK
jgi:plasmid stabilization system protein ParE